MPANFDPNAWYHISEERIANVTKPLKSTLQTTDNGLRVFKMVPQAWQMQPVDDVSGRYVMRLNTSGVGRHLTVCHDPEDLASSKTVACMRRASLEDSHKWFVEEIPHGEGGYRIFNVGNGSDYVLDVHPGSNLFLNGLVDGVTSDVYHPAQHWIFSKAREVNDGAWSTLYAGTSAVTSITNTRETSASNTQTANPSAETTTTTSTRTDAGSRIPEQTSSADSYSDSANNNSFSAGTAAGIAVASTIGLVLLVLGGTLSILFWWRRRRRTKKRKRMESAQGGGVGATPPSSCSLDEKSRLKRGDIVEVHDQCIIEASIENYYSELEASAEGGLRDWYPVVEQKSREWMT